jgi:hypothetical protein
VGFLDRLLIGGGVAWLARSVYRNAQEAQETKRRRSSPLSFNDGISQEDFAEMATAIADRTPRVLWAEIVGMTAVLRVESNTGLSIWRAKVDFNDYGHLTGAYWIDSDNSESLVPSYFADALSTQIETRTQAYAQARQSSEGPRSAPPNWYPTDVGLRYWDGAAWTQDVAPADYPAQAGRPIPVRKASRPIGIAFAWIVAILTAGYMLPWAVAVTRGTPNRNGVGLVCFFLGWTLIGWIAALVMACTD